MAMRRAIFGLAGPAVLEAEAAFFRDIDPWGFILFARNIETPDQVRRLTASLREAVGRDAPILIDQEGGRVQRLRPPHWRNWKPVQSLFDGADEARALEATRLRYRIIAEELRAVGIDVNCAPLLDVLAPEGHNIIGDRALGRDPDTVARRGLEVCNGLLAGGVLPVIKHIPGHGRASADSHLSLPRVDTPLAKLTRTDFAPFKALADQPLGMTAHVVFDALDPDACATESASVISMIRDDLGFDGLLMTDDLSMKALSGTMTRRTQRAIGAGCDVILHCNGVLTEMEEIAGWTPTLEGPSARRAERALASRKSPEPCDVAAADRAYATLVGEVPHG